jgi:hypothetical protein
MNVSHKGFIQIFSTMPKEISASLNNQKLEDNECFTGRFYSNIFRNAKRHACEFK